jgi:hypothetical protein
VQVFFGIKDRGIGERRISNLVEGVGAVGNEFTKEDLLVGVEGVFEDCRSVVHVQKAMSGLTDDQIEQLTDLSLESEAFGSHFLLSEAG